MLPWNQSKLSKQVEVIIPTDFYDIRATTPPKAGWTLMFSVAVFIYSIATVAFVLLYNYESGKSTVETVISPQIIPYKYGGYECQMISKVNEYFHWPGGSFSYGWNLVNVMETWQECWNNIKAASPCDTPMLYFPGTATDFHLGPDSFGGAAMFSSNMSYVFSIGRSKSKIVAYDYTRGEYGNGNWIYTDYNPQPHSLAVDRNGHLIYATSQYTTSTTTLVCRAYTYPNVPDKINFDTEAPAVLVYNDNLYNIYYATNESFHALNVYTSPAVPTLLFNLDERETLLYAAVYHDGTSPTVYYLTFSPDQIYLLYSHHDGVTTLLRNSVLLPGGLAVDGFNNLYILEVNTNGDSYELLSYLPNEANAWYRFPGIASLHTTTAPSGLAINALGDRIFFLYQDYTQNQAMAFYNPKQPKSAVSHGNSEKVRVLKGFGATWFACGDKLLDGSNYKPGVTAEYSQKCALNGVVGKIVYDNNEYIFTTTDASAYAVKDADNWRTQLYSTACNRVSDLPPYSCSRTLQQGFFSSAATAFANAQFLVQILILIGAVVLPFTASILPVRPCNNGENISTDDSYPEDEIEHAV